MHTYYCKWEWEAKTGEWSKKVMTEDLAMRLGVDLSTWQKDPDNGMHTLEGYGQQDRERWIQEQMNKIKAVDCYSAGRVQVLANRASEAVADYRMWTSEIEKDVSSIELARARVVETMTALEYALVECGPDPKKANRKGGRTVSEEVLDRRTKLWDAWNKERERDQRRLSETGTNKNEAGNAADEQKPRWESDEGKLYYGNKVVRDFTRRRAVLAEKILAAFEEEGWPPRIFNPLPIDKNLRKTLDTINGRADGITFRRDGTGEGIRWELEIPVIP